MTNLVSRAAYLSLCPKCRRSAVIICADDTESIRCATQARLKSEADRLTAQGKIAPDELPELKRQIDESGMIYRNDDLEAFIDLLRTNQTNTMFTPSPGTTVCRTTVDEEGRSHLLN